MISLKKLFKSWAFVISLIVLVLYGIYSNISTDFIIISREIVEIFFYLFLELLPLIIAIFSILISFTDKKFLNFLTNTKIDEDGTNFYDGTIHYFVVNSFIVFFDLIILILVLMFELYNIIYIQYTLLFFITYTIVGLIQLVRFIFYFARKKADFANLKS